MGAIVVWHATIYGGETEWIYNMEVQEIFTAMDCSKEFIPAFEQFIDMVRALESKEMSMMEHSKVEQWVGKSGTQ
ncbi:MAG: hypothetical protein K8F91_15525 [Candidatus Obscuribacterales bacterium]|nr:hypothetical protein [Candidatus Obscuribacterales bacterium]